MNIHPNLLVVPFRRLSELIEQNSGQGISAKTALVDSIAQLCVELERLSGVKKEIDKLTTEDLRTAKPLKKK